MSINMTAGPERASVQKNYVADIVGPLSIYYSSQRKELGTWPPHAHNLETKPAHVEDRQLKSFSAHYCEDKKPD